MYQNGTKGYETPTEGGNNVSEQNQPKKQDYSCYDKMSTEELEEILHLDFLASEDGESDLDAILYISDLLAQRTQLSNTEAAWEQFQTEYRPYADGQSLYEFDCDRETSEKEPISTVPTPYRHRRVVYLRRVGVLVAALIACMLGGVVMAQAMGLNFFHVLAQWTDETFQFVNATSTASQTRTEMSQELQFFLQELEMEELFPTWYPDEFTPREPRVQENHSSTTVSVAFIGDNRSFSVRIMRYFIPVGDKVIFEKDETPVELYEHNGRDFYLLSNLDTMTATTYDGEFMVTIGGELTREEIIAIIDSIHGSQAMQNREQMSEQLELEGQLLYYPPDLDGFYLVDTDFSIRSTDEACWIEGYENGEQFLGFQVLQHKVPPGTVHEKDNGPVEEYEYHGVIHYLFTNNQSMNATWMIENVEYTLWLVNWEGDLRELIRQIYYQQDYEQMQKRLLQENQILSLPQIPDGLNLTQSYFYLDSTLDESTFFVCYEQGEQHILYQVVQHRTVSSTSVYEKDNTPVEEYTYGNITYYIFENLDSTTVAWMVDNVEYALIVADGTADVKELIQSLY